MQVIYPTSLLSPLSHYKLHASTTHFLTPFQTTNPDRHKDLAARVVVAGATGNVGSAAVHKLSQMGVEVKALTRSSAGEKGAPLQALEHVQLVECDIADQSTLSGVFEGVKAAFLTCGNFRGQVAAEKVRHLPPSTLFRTPLRAFPGRTPPTTRRVPCSTWWPCFAGC